ncbi:mechanosensitive ion channel family protein, partial [Frankia sp. CcWB3]
MHLSAAPDLSFSDMRSTIAVLTILGGAVLLALAVSVLLHRMARRIGRHSEIVADLAQHGKRPTRLTLVLVALLVGLNSTAEQAWTEAALRVSNVALIAGIAWCVTVLAFTFEDLALARYRVDVVDNRHARRVRTQVTLLRRVTVVIISIIAGASMLMTFPSVRVAGASIFASAGVVGIVAGLAAQTSLSNVFAGLQLAFTDAIRVDDVVVVEKEWGRIEEITLTYVVVHIWDDRRMVLPSTYFTTTPFQNWTRKESAVLGAVELDLDWAIPIDEMRAEMHRVLDATDLWDKRVCVLQVTDAIGDHIRIRVLVSGKDGPTVFDLRCHMREELVRWVQHNHPTALPRTRIEFDASAHLLGLRLPDQGRPDDRDGRDHPDGHHPGSRSDRLRKTNGIRLDEAPARVVPVPVQGLLSPTIMAATNSAAVTTASSASREAETDTGGGTSTAPADAHADAAEDARLFSGASADAAKRARNFSGTSKIDEHDSSASSPPPRDDDDDAAHPGESTRRQTTPKAHRGRNE